MSRSNSRLAPGLSAIGASALLMIAALGSDVAQAQGAVGSRGAAAQSHRATTVSSRIPQQARDRMPEQATSRLPSELCQSIRERRLRAASSLCAGVRLV